MNFDELVKLVESYFGRLLVEDEKKWISESIKADPTFSARLIQRVSNRS